eukprot:7434-Heterococcus_DN1.PRE.1
MLSYSTDVASSAGTLAQIEAAAHRLARSSCDGCCDSTKGKGCTSLQSSFELNPARMRNIKRALDSPQQAGTPLLAQSSQTQCIQVVAVNCHLCQPESATAEHHDVFSSSASWEHQVVARAFSCKNHRRLTYISRQLPLG